MPVTIAEQQLLDVLRSDGVIDAGAASCCLILEIMAGTIGDLLACNSEARL